MYSYSVCLFSFHVHDVLCVVKCVVFVICLFRGFLLRKCFWLLFIGKPDPVVSWYVNGELEDSTYHVNRFGEVINELAFRGLNRSHLGSHFSCRASNTRLIQPVEKSVVLDLNCKLHTLSKFLTQTLNLLSVKQNHCSVVWTIRRGGRRKLSCSWNTFTLTLFLNIVFMFQHTRLIEHY